jgi:hypothetical protein
MKKINMSYLHWQAIIDAAENAGTEEQKVIRKIANEICDLYEMDSADVTIELWDREIKEVLASIEDGKMFNSHGAWYLKQAINNLRYHLEPKNGETCDR